MIYAVNCILHGWCTVSLWLPTKHDDCLRQPRRRADSENDFWTLWWVHQNVGRLLDRLGDQILCCVSSNGVQVFVSAAWSQRHPGSATSPLFRRRLWCVFESVRFHSEWPSLLIRVDWGTHQVYQQGSKITKTIVNAVQSQRYRRVWYCDTYSWPQPPWLYTEKNYKRQDRDRTDGACWAHLRWTPTAEMSSLEWWSDRVDSRLSSMNLWIQWSCCCMNPWMSRRLASRSSILAASSPGRLKSLHIISRSLLPCLIDESRSANSSKKVGLEVDGGHNMADWPIGTI